MSNALTQVYIGNLPLDVNEERFVGIISENGGNDYESFRLAKDHNGAYRGFGYVDYDGKDKAMAVVEAMKGVEVDGRILKVDVATPRAEKIPRENTVFIGNLSFEATKEGVFDMVNDVMGEGKVAKVRISLDRLTQRPRGFGYIDFVDAESADRAMEVLNGLNLDGRNIRVDRPTIRDDNGPRRFQRDNRHTIFLGNLSWDVTTELLEDMLNDLLGENQFVKVRMSVDSITKKMKGFAHVDFVDEEAALRALSELNGIELLGRTVRVDRAKRADER